MANSGNRPSYSAALRMAKAVKLCLAGGADGAFVRVTADDRRRMYSRADDRQGKTVNDVQSAFEYQRKVMKDIFGE